MSKFHPQNTEKKTDPDFWYLREIQEDIGLPGRINKHKSAMTITLPTKIYPDGIRPLQIIYRANTSSLIVLDSARNQRVHFFQGATMEHIGSLKLQGNSVADIAYVDNSLIMLDKNTNCLKIIDLMKVKSEMDNFHVSGKSSPEIDLSDFSISKKEIIIPPELANKALRFYVWTNSADKVNYTMWIPNSNILLTGIETSNIIQMNTVVLHIPESLNSLQIGSLTYSTLSDALYVADSSSGFVLELQSLNKSSNMVKVIAGGSLLGFHMGLAVESRLGSISGLCTYSIEEGQRVRLSDVISHNAKSQYWSDIIKLKRRQTPSSLQIAELLKYSQFIVAVDSKYQVAVSISLPRHKNSQDMLLKLYKISRPAKVLPLLENIKSIDDQTNNTKSKISFAHNNVTMAPSSSLLFWSHNCCDMTYLPSGIDEYLAEVTPLPLPNTWNKSSPQSSSNQWPQS